MFSIILLLCGFVLSWNFGAESIRAFVLAIAVNITAAAVFAIIAALSVKFFKSQDVMIFFTASMARLLFAVLLFLIIIIVSDIHKFWFLCWSAYCYFVMVFAETCITVIYLNLLEGNKPDISVKDVSNTDNINS